MITSNSEFSGGESERDRPHVGQEAFISGKENCPMIAMPAESYIQVVGALAQISEIFGRLGPNEQVKEKPSPAPKEWYSADEAAKELNRSSYQIRELCRRKVFGQKDSGGKWWIHRKDIENFRNGRTLIHGEVF